VQAILRPGALGEQLVAVVGEQLQIPGGRVGSRRRQLLPRGHTGDRMGVARIALAVPAQPHPLTLGHVTAHIAHVLALLEQEAREPVAEPAAALDPEPPLPRRPPAHPGMQPPVTPRLIRELVDRQLPAELVDHADRERALVRIDPDEHHLDPPVRADAVPRPRP
jgi:hypothetical protein